MLCPVKSDTTGHSIETAFSLTSAPEVGWQIAYFFCWIKPSFLSPLTLLSYFRCTPNFLLFSSRNLHPSIHQFTFPFVPKLNNSWIILHSPGVKLIFASKKVPFVTHFFTLLVWNSWSQKGSDKNINNDDVTYGSNLWLAHFSR